MEWRVDFPREPGYYVRVYQQGSHEYDGAVQFITIEHFNGDLYEVSHDRQDLHRLGAGDTHTWFWLQVPALPAGEDK